MNKDNEKEVFIKALTTRGPNKRQIKPIDKDSFQLFEDFDSDSDEDFVASSDEESDDDIEKEESGSNSKNEESNSEDEQDSSDSEKESVANEDVNNNVSEDKKNKELIEINPKETKAKLESIMICMMCLLDDTYSDNEIVECDNCGITVHEDCYKVNDSVFISCDSSDASTDPWFCDACLLGIKQPMCELCPYSGGVFKKTEDNRWVHLICALYTPGVAFNDTDNLTEITLTEIPFKEWSGHECIYCSDPFYARTGVCISCDAGLCKNYFHVTCAHKEGFLSEPHLEENQDDPFFAQCRQHTDKEIAKRRRKHWTAALNSYKMRLDLWNVNKHQTDSRIVRKLNYFNDLYNKYKDCLPEPFVPSNKIPSYLELSPVSVSLFMKKAHNLQLPMDTINSLTYNNETKTSANSGIPTFTPDFITYYLEREKKIDETISEISRLENFHRDLQISEQNASHKFNKMSSRKESMINSFKSKLTQLTSSFEILKQLSADKDIINRMQIIIDSVDFNTTEINTQNDTNEKELQDEENGGNVKDSIIQVCKTCNSVNDQHLLIDCDACKNYFHIGCLDPPLTRMPKKTKQYGWQCSDCTASSSDDNMKPNENIDVNKPRQLRKSADSSVIKMSLKRKLALPLSTDKTKKTEHPVSKKPNLENSTSTSEQANTSSRQLSRNLVNEAKKRQNKLNHNRSCRNKEPIEVISLLSSSSTIKDEKSNSNSQKLSSESSKSKETESISNGTSKIKSETSSSSLKVPKSEPKSESPIKVVLASRLIHSQQNSNSNNDETKSTDNNSTSTKQETESTRSDQKHSMSAQSSCNDESSLNTRKSNRSRKRPLSLLDEIEGPDSKPRKHAKKSLPTDSHNLVKYRCSHLRTSITNGKDKPNIKLKIIKQPITFFRNETMNISPQKMATNKNNENKTPIDTNDADHHSSSSDSPYQQIIGVVAKRVAEPLKFATALGSDSCGQKNKTSDQRKKSILIKLHNDDDEVENKTIKNEDEDDDEATETMVTNVLNKTDDISKLKESVLSAS